MKQRKSSMFPAGVAVSQASTYATTSPQHPSPAAVAGQAVRELAAFRELTGLGNNWFLVDTGTGAVLADYAATPDGTFILDGGAGINIGVDPRGLFVVARTDPPRELFRALRLEQRVTPQERVRNCQDLWIGVSRGLLFTS